MFKQMYLENLELMRAENERLKKENADLLYQFARWAYNAYAHGMRSVQLDKPSAPVDRGQVETALNID